MPQSLYQISGCATRDSGKSVFDRFLNQNLTNLLFGKKGKNVVFFVFDGIVQVPQLWILPKNTVKTVKG